VRNLAKIYLADAASPLLRSCVLQLYEGALFMEGNLVSPVQYVERMVDIMTRATSA